MDDILDRFDAAWRKGERPAIDEFLKELELPERVAAADDSLHQELLVQLIEIDLEYCWKTAADQPLESAVLDGRQFPARPRLEDYLKRFPELGALQNLPSDLIGEEYRVRHRWGDRPEHREYAVRFGGSEAEFAESLSSIDKEIELEVRSADARIGAADDAGGLTLIMGGVSPKAWSHEIRSQFVTVGRADDADIRLTHPSVSRYHCRLWRSLLGCHIEDLGSTNGTFVNRKRTSRHTLEHGDSIQVGTFELTAVRTESLRTATAPNMPIARPIESRTAPILSEISEERRLAAEVHYRLTPSRRIALPHLMVDVIYRPSGRLGGDYFEYLQFEDRYLLGLFDSMNHGIKAALTLMLLRAELERWFSLTDSPSECMKWINREIVDLQMGDLYLCGCLAVWYPQRQMMVVATAGHPRPLVIRGEALCGDEFEASGLPLGVSAEESFTEQIYELQPGDKLYLFSDGVTQSLSLTQAVRPTPDALAVQLLRYNDRPLSEQMNQVLDDVEAASDDDVILVGCEVLDD